jgi:hypothetical protein
LIYIGFCCHRRGERSAFLLSATSPSSRSTHNPIAPSVIPVISVLGPLLLSDGTNSFSLNFFADPHALNSVASIFYKNKVGEGCSLRSPFPKSFPCHRSGNSPLRRAIATDPTTPSCKSFPCHTFRHPPGSPLRPSACGACPDQGRDVSALSLSPLLLFSTQCSATCSNPGRMCKPKEPHAVAAPEPHPQH